MKARVIVTLKDGILDPQGKAIEGALKSLGVEGSTACGRARFSRWSLRRPIALRQQDCCVPLARNC